MSKLPHGKSPSHLMVAVSDNAPSVKDRGLAVTPVALCPIAQNPAGEPIIIVGPLRHEDRGLHLRADAWAFMVGQISAHVALCRPGQTIQLEHFQDPDWIVAYTISTGEATRVAHLISMAAEGLGA